MLARRLAATAFLGAVLAAAGAVPAGGHVEPEVAEVAAGATVTLPFAIEHGCDDSPTVEVAVRVPDGVVGVAAVAQAGWEATVDGREVRWTGGSLPADQPATFSITATMPATPGVELAFPFVQTCEEGTLSWIETGPGEHEYPAPLVRLGPADPAATTTPAPAETTAPSTSAPKPDERAAGDDSRDGSGDDGPPAALWVVIGALALAAAGGIGFVITRRRA